MLTRALIEKLLSRKNRSAVIDVSSFVSTVAMPMLELYSATKAYNVNFTRSLNQEFRSKVDFVALTPMSVESNLTNQSIEKGVIKQFISAEQFTESSLNLLGRTNFSCGNYSHSI